MRILFMGTPAFAVPSLEVLAAGGHLPCAVVTGPDKPRGRGRRMHPTAVKKAAERLGIARILQPESVKAPEFAEAVRALAPDVIVVVAFRILPPAVFEAARLGAFNLHASLLPRYRGAAPINRALMAGETESGVTTFFLKKAVDTGNIILRWPTRIGPNETATELHDRLMLLGARAVLETTRRIAAGRANALPQDGAQASPAPKIFRDECRIPWHLSAASVHNHCRGLSLYPGAWTLHGAHRIKVLSTRMSDVRVAGAPGTATVHKGRLHVACGTGAVEILSLQGEGRRRMRAADFLNGYDLPTGANLE